MVFPTAVFAEEMKTVLSELKQNISGAAAEGQMQEMLGLFSHGFYTGTANRQQREEALQEELAKLQPGEVPAVLQGSENSPNGFYLLQGEKQLSGFGLNGGRIEYALDNPLDEVQQPLLNRIIGNVALFVTDNMTDGSTELHVEMNGAATVIRLAGETGASVFSYAAGTEEEPLLVVGLVGESDSNSLVIGWDEEKNSPVMLLQAVTNGQRLMLNNRADVAQLDEKGAIAFTGEGEVSFLCYENGKAEGWKVNVESGSFSQEEGADAAPAEGKLEKVCEALRLSAMLSLLENQPNTRCTFCGLPGEHEKGNCGRHCIEEPGVHYGCRYCGEYLCNGESHGNGKGQCGDQQTEVTPAPTQPATAQPTAQPVPVPTVRVTVAPTATPAAVPTAAPTAVPTVAPTTAPAPESVSCPSCGAEVEDENAHLCDKADCGGYTCDDEDHSTADCGQEGHTNCDGKDHDAATCGQEGHTNCDGKDHDAATCGQEGHTNCDGKDHDAADCGQEGHINCDGKDHNAATCGQEGHTNCDGDDHEAADCGQEGHTNCDGKDHDAATCGQEGHTNCDGKDHEAADCGQEGHTNCDGKDHQAATCGQEGHTNCDGMIHGAPCGVDGHYGCDPYYDAQMHAQCEHCSGYVCDGEHGECWNCNNGYICQPGHEVCPNPDCTSRICGSDIHVACEYCDDYWCNYYHEKHSCGRHCAQMPGEHAWCDACDAYQCDGKDHAQARCGQEGHTNCDGENHDHPGCDNPDHCWAMFPSDHGYCEGTGLYKCNPEHSADCEYCGNSDFIPE